MEVMFRCPRCNSSQTTFRVRTNDRYCYKCGNSYIEEIKKEDNN